MASDISFLQYMRAHGNTAGPTQRPLLTGVISGVLAAGFAFVVLHLTAANEAVCRYFGVNYWLGLSIFVAWMAVGGVLYAAVFKRAANDHNGGWLFGISYGFLLWILSPITLWQIATREPVATGGAAMGLFGSHLVFGLTLGLVFPYVHSLIQSRLKAEWETASHDVDKQEKGATTDAVL